MNDAILVVFVIVIAAISLAGSWLKGKVRKKSYEAGKKWAEKRRSASSDN